MFSVSTSSRLEVHSHLESDQPSTSSCVSQQSIVPSLIEDDVFSAEIYWTLDYINNHVSYNSSKGKAGLFRFMFPDSDIAKRFSCDATKMLYLAAFGIASCLSSRLAARVKSCDVYVLLFDETLNKPLQEKQLDVLVHYWDGDMIASRYFDSHFMGHAKDKDLYEPMRSYADTFGMRKSLQLSMDGPNVNWKLFRNLAKDIEDQTDKQLLNVGSCGLHILHNAYKIGINSCPWDVEVLYALHWLFKDTPARCKKNCLVTGSTKFPLNYCKNRWLENVPVIERTIQIWPSIQQYVEAVHANKTLRPKNKSFTTVEHATKDLLFITKLNICLSIAQICQEFLTKYQTDAPMIPFLCDDLFKLIKRLLERFVKDNEMIKLTTPVKLFKDNFRDKFSQSNCHKDASAINVGFVAEQELRGLKLHKKKSPI